MSQRLVQPTERFQRRSGIITCSLLRTHASDMKAILQILAALILFSIAVQFVSSPRIERGPPSALAPFAKYVADRVDPAQLQTWASNVVATHSREGDPLIEVPWQIAQIPAPCTSWTGTILWPEDTNAPVRLRFVSVGGFGSYGIIVGPQWWLDTYERSEMVAPGIYVEMYP